MTEDDNQNEREERAEIAKINLSNQYLTNLAASALGTTDAYGKVPSRLYDATIRQTPDQATYEQVHLPELQNETGSLTQSRLKDNAKNIIVGSINRAKLSDLFELMGSESTLSEAYQDMYFEDLSDEEKQTVRANYVRSLVNDKVIRFLSAERTALTGGLEQMFCEQPEEEERVAGQLPQRQERQAA